MGTGAGSVTVEVGSQIGRALITQVAIFLQSLVDDALQLRGHVGIEAHGGDWAAIEDGFEDLRGAAAMKWKRARRHLVEDGAERE